MDLAINHRPYLDGTLTVWSLGKNWGFSFDNGPQHAESPYRVLLEQGFRRVHRMVTSRVKMPRSMVNTLEAADQTEVLAPSRILASAAMAAEFPVFILSESEEKALEDRVEPHLPSIAPRLLLEDGAINGPLADLSDEDAAWLLEHNATLAFSDAGINLSKEGVWERHGAWAYYSTERGLRSGLCELDVPTSGKAEMFAAEAAVRAHDGYVLLLVDSHEVKIAAEGITGRSPLLNAARESGRLRVSQIKGHAGCVGNELVDAACREVNRERRRLANKMEEAAKRVQRVRKARGGMRKLTSE